MGIDQLLPLGPVVLRPDGPAYEVFLAVSVTPERYGPATARLSERPNRGVERELGLAIAPPAGERDYVFARIVTRRTDYRLTVGLTGGGPAPPQVGVVEGVDDVGYKLVPLGSAQAWHYREARTLILWECLPTYGMYGPQPEEEARRDPLLRAAWEGLERFLAERFPQAGRIYTGGTDPAYGDWAGFLIDRGWAPDPAGPADDAPNRWTRPWPPSASSSPPSGAPWPPAAGESPESPARIP
jgi:hypothetical protein